jgi:hypothetical protein
VEKLFTPTGPTVGEATAATQSDRFDLIFEGPADLSPKTLQRVKGAFIADLDLSVEAAQRALTQAPTVIYSSESEDLATKYFEILKRAGAKVLIVKAETTPREPEAQPPAADVPAATVPAPPVAAPVEKPSPIAFEVEDSTSSAPIEAPQIPPSPAPAPKEAKSPDDALLFPNVVLQKAEPKNKKEDLLFAPEQPQPSPKTPTNTKAALSLEEVGKVLDDALPKKNLSVTTLPASVALLQLDIDEPAAPAMTPQSVKPKPSPEAPRTQDNDDFDLSLAVDEPVGGHTPIYPVPKAEEPEEEGAPPVKATAAEDFALAPDADFREEPLPSKNKVVASVKESKKPKTAPPNPSPTASGPSLKDLVAGKRSLACPVDKVEPTSFTEEEADVEALALAPEVQRPSRHVVRDLLLLFLAGLIILAIGNWAYENLLMPKADNSIQVTPELLGQSPQGLTPEEATFAGKKMVSGTIKFNLSRQNVPRHVDAATVLQATAGKQTASLKFAMGLPAPAELTPVEIVQKKAPPLWLYKIEVDAAALPVTEQKFEAAVPVRFYVQQGKNRTRGIGKGLVSGVISDDAGSLQLTVQIFAGLDTMPNEEIPLRFVNEGRYLFALRETISMPGTKVRETPPPDRS